LAQKAREQNRVSDLPICELRILRIVLSHRECGAISLHKQKYPPDEKVKHLGSSPNGQLTLLTSHKEGIVMPAGCLIISV
jgi:hypothetical protein